MSKEVVAVIALATTLVASVFAFGMRIGTLTERVDYQTGEIRALRAEIAGINQHLIAYTLRHREEEAAQERRTTPVSRRGGN